MAVEDKGMIEKKRMRKAYWIDMVYIMGPDLCRGFQSTTIKTIEIDLTLCQGRER